MAIKIPSNCEFISKSFDHPSNFTAYKYSSRCEFCNLKMDDNVHEWFIYDENGFVIIYSNYKNSTPYFECRNVDHGFFTCPQSSKSFCPQYKQPINPFQ